MRGVIPCLLKPRAPCSKCKSLHKDGEALAQVAQRGGRNPVPGDIQGQAGQGTEQPHLAVGVLVHCREVGLGGL